MKEEPTHILQLNILTWKRLTSVIFTAKLKCYITQQKNRIWSINKDRNKYMELEDVQVHRTKESVLRTLKTFGLSVDEMLPFHIWYKDIFKSREPRMTKALQDSIFRRCSAIGDGSHFLIKNIKKPQLYVGKYYVKKIMLRK